jgi:hypothetical protein
MVRPHMIQSASQTPLCSQRPWPLFILFVSLISFGCRGSNSVTQQVSSPPPPPSTPDFALGVNPTAVTVFPNNGTPVSVFVTGVNGFAAQISVHVTGLPAGVTASPSGFDVAPDATQTVVLFAFQSEPICLLRSTKTS